jgi:hypothetical protein
MPSQHPGGDCHLQKAGFDRTGGARLLQRGEPGRVGWIARHFFRCPKGAPFLVRRAEGPVVEAGRVAPHMFKRIMRFDCVARDPDGDDELSRRCGFQLRLRPPVSLCFRSNRADWLRSQQAIVE